MSGETKAPASGTNSGTAPGAKNSAAGKTRIITLDGPAGVGKSTLAGRTAEALGLACLDTGAMFRTIALGLGRQGLVCFGENAGAVSGTARASVEPSEDALETALRDFHFALEGSGLRTALLCNGRAVGEEIRSEEAGMMAATVAKMPRVRAFLKTAQRSLGAAFSLVAEGRDMGTAVFPAADCKIFLDAGPRVRAMRRYLQLREKGQDCDLDELAAQIAARDAEDRNRSLAPLRPAEDAVIIDTSDMDLEAVFAAIMRAVREKAVCG